MKNIKYFFIGNNNILYIIALTIMVVACGRGQNNPEQTEAPIQQQNQLNEMNEDTFSTQSSNQYQSVSGQDDAEVMLNPPHGEPNHRCDIPVGSPLNAQANNGPSIRPQDSKNTPSTTSANQPVSGQNDTEVELNPPHGEPNHRCDIPVGSPLNATENNMPSKTNNEATVSTKRDPANNPYAPTVENAERLKSTQTNRTATAPTSSEKPRNNPPHGEPWHQCDIAVGSPLP